MASSSSPGCRPGYFSGGLRVRIVLASHNRHKAEELTRLLPGHQVQVYPGEFP